MKFFLLLFSLVAVITPVTAETIQEHGKRTIDEAVAALGGEAFLNMADRIETGRAYSFYREELSGLSIARIYTRYLTRPEPPVHDYIGVRERQNWGTFSVVKEGVRPSLIIEVTSPKTRKGDMVDKVDEYALAGVPLGAWRG